MTQNYTSWGYRPEQPQMAQAPTWRTHPLSDTESSLLPYGNGRSYGDSCLNSDGIVIDSRQLNNLIDFDVETGILKCESGVLFSDIINSFVPRGWFLPVTPGTRFITVGGAIANDVHGKNHHKSGTFGQFVKSFELCRSDGSRQICSETENTELYAATIGGLGLTGWITWAEIQLHPITSTLMDVTTTAFSNLNEFYELSSSTSNENDYSVAWIDCISKGDSFGKGIFYAGNHGVGQNDSIVKKFKLKSPGKAIPFNLPGFTLNPLSVTAFNKLYYSRHKSKSGRSEQSIDDYFYPLDNIKNWNRIYGSKGFFQYQFTVPKDRKEDLEKVLKLIAESNSASFLAVLKEFGDIKSPGILSFPKPGYCLALDFPDRGKKTRQLLKELDSIVMSAGGQVYPAKDRTMSADAFKAYYPQVSEFIPYIDSKFNSDFWNRVMPNV